MKSRTPEPAAPGVSAFSALTAKLTIFGARTITRTTSLPSSARCTFSSAWARASPARRRRSAGDLERRAHLAVHLHSGGDGVFDEQRRIAERHCTRPTDGRTDAHISSAECGRYPASPRARLRSLADSRVRCPGARVDRLADRADELHQAGDEHVELRLPDQSGRISRTGGGPPGGARPRRRAEHHADRVVDVMGDTQCTQELLRHRSSRRRPSPCRPTA